MSIYKAIMSHLFSTFVNGVNQNADVLEQLKSDHESHLSENVTQEGGVHGLEIERGTFTPEFCIGDYVGYTGNGSYVKIDQLVYIHINKYVDSIKSYFPDKTGDFSIKGLPFVCKDASLATGAMAYTYGFNVACNNLIWVINTNGTEVSLRQITGAGPAEIVPLNDTNLAGVSSIYIRTVYRTS